MGKVFPESYKRSKVVLISSDFHRGQSLIQEVLEPEI